MSLVRTLLAVLLASSTSLLACTAAPEDVDEADTESTEEVSSALANTGGTGGAGLTATECTSCGCSLVFIEKVGDCRTYKCVCESDAAAKCAGGKAMMISVPITPVRKLGSYVGTISGTAVAAP